MSNDREVVYDWHGVKLTGVHPGSGPPEAHEEEYKHFMEMLDRIEGTEPVMIELGSFWCLWTILFKKRFPKGRAITVEMDFDPRIKTGLMNLHLNDVAATLHYAKVVPQPCLQKPSSISLEEIIAQNNIDTIDVLHMDIQGMEFLLKDTVDGMLKSGQLKNMFMATHNNVEHAKMMQLFSKHKIHHHKDVNGMIDGEIIVENNK